MSSGGHASQNGQGVWDVRDYIAPSEPLQT